MEVTLAESLKINANWEIAHFGYNGPYAPYVRIGLGHKLGKPWIFPAFESWIKDGIIRRTKIDAYLHLKNYNNLLIGPEAFEEAQGRESADLNQFAINRWMTIEDRRMECVVLRDCLDSYIVEMPWNVLAVASKVVLRK